MTTADHAASAIASHERLRVGLGAASAIPRPLPSRRNTEPRPLAEPVMALPPRYRDCYRAGLSGQSTNCVNSKGSGPSAQGNSRERMKERSSYFRLCHIILPAPRDRYIACTIWPLPCLSGGSHATRCRQSRPQDTVLDLKQDSSFPIRCRFVAA